MQLTDLKTEAAGILLRLRDVEDDEHAVAILHTALVMVFKYGQESRAADGKPERP